MKIIFLILLTLGYNTHAEVPKNLQEVIEFTKQKKIPERFAHEIIFIYASETQTHVRDIIECIEADFGRRNFDCFKSEFYNMKGIYKVAKQELADFKQACYSYQIFIGRKDLAKMCEDELNLE